MTTTFASWDDGEDARNSSASAKRSAAEINEAVKTAALYAERAVNAAAKYAEENRGKNSIYESPAEIKNRRLQHLIDAHSRVCKEQRELLHKPNGEIRDSLTSDEFALLEVLGYELEETATKIKKILKGQLA